MTEPIANAEMAEWWNGPQGEHWAAHPDHYSAELRAYSARLYDAARFSSRDRVLDVGCGTGETTRAAARSASSAFGIDLSRPMLAQARARARDEHLTNVQFVEGDAQTYSFEEGGFDLVISRFGAMFFADQHAAFRNLARALGSHGRLALLAWRPLAENVWSQAIRAALALGRTLPEPPIGGIGPYGLADAGASARMLIECGFDDVTFEAIDELMYYGTDADAAFGFLRGSGSVVQLTADLDDADRERALDALHAMLETYETADGVQMPSAAWLITAKR